MDNTQYLFLDIPTVQRLIAEKDAADKYRNDELTVAIFLSKFCEKIWNTTCAIGFPIRNSETSSIPLVGNSSLQELKNILNTKTEQAHDVDALIVKHTPENSKRTGQGFQIKRFHTRQADLTTEGIIKFIQGLNYSKTDTALVVLLETGEATKFTQVRSSIDFKKFPFSALYFVTLHGDVLKFIEVWPNLGKEELDWLSV
jgi:hypothetical protein